MASLAEQERKLEATTRRHDSEVQRLRDDLARKSSDAEDVVATRDQQLSKLKQEVEKLKEEASFSLTLSHNAVTKNSYSGDVIMSVFRRSLERVLRRSFVAKRRRSKSDARWRLSRWLPRCHNTGRTSKRRSKRRRRSFRI